MKKILAMLIMAALSMSSCMASETPAISDFPRIRTPEPLNPGYTSETASAGDNTEKPADGRVLYIAYTDYGNAEDASIYKLAQKYMEQNSGVTIEFDYQSDNRLSVTKYIRGLASLNGGRGPDIVSIKSSTAPDFYKNSSFINFVDLNELISADEEFDKADYYWNVAEAAMLFGEMRFIPFTFFFETVSVNNKYANLLDAPVDSLKTIDIAKMTEMYERARLSNNGRELYMLDAQPNIFLEYYWALDLDSVDVEKGEVDLGSDGRRELLVKLLEFPKLPPETAKDIFKQTSFSPPADILFATSHGLGIDLSTCIQFNESLYTHPLLLTGLNGKASCYYYDTAAITKDSANKELAWDFIKFCINSQSYGMSINRSVFRQNMTETLSNRFEYYSRNGHTPISDKAFAVDNAVTRLEEMADMISQTQLSEKVDFLTLLYRVNNQYTNKKITVDEALVQIESGLRAVIGEHLY